MKILCTQYDYNSIKYSGIRNKSFNSFGGSKISYIKHSTLRKITSESEYDRIMSDLKNKRVWSGWWSRGDKFEEGLMPYVGQEDISNRINSYLRNNQLLDNRYSYENIENIIRLLDYALSETDKIYGTYRGLVYRYGQVDNESKNFLSTSRTPDGSVSFVEEKAVRHPYSQPFYIISVRNGHKVENVLKKLNYIDSYINESEILLNPTFFTVPNSITPEMQNAAAQLLESLNKNRFYCRPNIRFLEEV